MTKSRQTEGIFSNRQLRKLIIPLILEQLLAVTVGMVDTVMVSAAGEAAVSGVSIVDEVMVLMINVFAALGTGGAVIVGHAITVNLGNIPISTQISIAKLNVEIASETIQIRRRSI